MLGKHGFSCAFNVGVSCMVAVTVTVAITVYDAREAPYFSPFCNRRCNRRCNRPRNRLCNGRHLMGRPPSVVPGLENGDMGGDSLSKNPWSREVRDRYTWFAIENALFSSVSQSCSRRRKVNCYSAGIVLSVALPQECYDQVDAEFVFT